MRVPFNPFKENVMVKKLVAALLLGMGMLSLSACNTIEGAGKDVKAGGAAVEEAAREAKPK